MTYLYKKKKDMDEQIQRVCNKMAEIAGLKVDSWTDGSHLSMIWTKEQQDSFTEWLYDELMSNRGLRHAMMNSRICTKQLMRKASEEFVAFHGFTLIT